MIRRLFLLLLTGVGVALGTWAVITYGAVVLVILATACFLPGLLSSLGVRRTLLAVTLVTLAAARAVQLIPVSGVENLRYVAVMALVAVTWRQAAALGNRVSLAESPRNARLLVTALWLLAILAAVSIAWSVARFSTALQTGAFLLLVTLVHLSVKLWRDRSTLVLDMQVIYFTLAATILGGLGVPRDRSGRLSGLYNNPNGLAQITALTALIGIGLYVETRRKCFFLGTAPLLAVLVLTESRTALIAFAAGGAFFVLKGGARSLMRAVAASAIALSCWVLFNLPLPTGVQSAAARFTDAPGDAGTLNGRGPIWDYALLLWHKEPLTGYGFRTGDVIFNADHALAGFSKNNQVAHSSYLQMLVELGLLGMIPFSILVVAAIRIIAKSQQGAMERALAACIVAGLLVGFAESSMFGIGQPFAWVLWISAAGAAAQAFAPKQGTDDEASQVSTDGSFSPV